MPHGVRHKLAGKVFGKLSVIEPAKNLRPKCTAWLCQCECGKKVVVGTACLVTGGTRSCGCIRREPRKHGMSKSVLYRVWADMRNRCNCPTHPCYARYGGRGIKVCKRWDDFVKFAADMGERPSNKHSIERENNDRGYSPGNCVWATKKQQNRNTSRSRFITVGGVKKTLAQWAEDEGLSPRTIFKRLSLGWSPERAVKTRPLPPTASKRHVA